MLTNLNPNVPVHSAASFHWKGSVGTAEASELPSTMTGRVFRDTNAVGFKLRSPVTGQVSRVLKLVQKHEASDGYSACDAPYIEDLDGHDPGEVFWNAADDLQYITYQANERRVYTVYLTSAARRARGIEKGYDLR